MLRKKKSVTPSSFFIASFNVLVFLDYVRSAGNIKFELFTNTMPKTDSPAAAVHRR